jgi:hypothetical protein
MKANVTIFEHPAGSLVRIEIDGRILVLDREQAFDLMEEMNRKLAELPSVLPVPFKP